MAVAAAFCFQGLAVSVCKTPLSPGMGQPGMLERSLRASVSGVRAGSWCHPAGSCALRHASKLFMKSRETASPAFWDPFLLPTAGPKGSGGCQLWVRTHTGGSPQHRLLVHELCLSSVTVNAWVLKSDLGYPSGVARPGLLWGVLNNSHIQNKRKE